MRTLMRFCKACGRYTLRGACPACGTATVMRIPPRFSPEDRYGAYRRQMKKEASLHGEHYN